jgi:hypothetical protein
MKHKNKKRQTRLKTKLGLPDLEHAKLAVIVSLRSFESQRSYRHSIDEFVAWYCSAPRLSLNKTVVLRYRLHLEDRHLAAGTINVRLAAVRRLAYEAADSGLLSPDHAAGIRSVKGVKKLGCRLGNWLTAEQARVLWQQPDPDTLKGKRDRAILAVLSARGLFSVERIVSGATVVFAAVTLAIATLHVLWLLCILSLFGGAAWTVLMSVFNILTQKLAPDWVRARVLAIYLLVFQGSIALGSTLWGVAADHTSAGRALMFSSAGITVCLVLPFAARLPEPPGSLDVWNHWGKLSMFEDPEPDEGPVLVIVEYKIDPATESQFLDAMHEYQRIRRRDGAIR